MAAAATDGGRLRTLSAVFAHPDDETFATGGTLAKYAEEGARVTLYCATDGDAGRTSGIPFSSREELGRGITDADGRQRALLPAGAQLLPGVYRITFHTGAYFEAHATTGFYPEVTVTFEVRDGAQHYHVPLLLNPFGYSTYRGS